MNASKIETPRNFYRSTAWNNGEVQDTVLWAFRSDNFSCEKWYMERWFAGTGWAVQTVSLTQAEFETQKDLHHVMEVDEQAIRRLMEIDGEVS